MSRSARRIALTSSKQPSTWSLISHWDGYDYVLINDHVEGCFDEVRAILRAERLKRRRQIGLIGFARDLIRSVPDADKNL